MILPAFTGHNTEEDIHPSRDTTCNPIITMAGPSESGVVLIGHFPRWANSKGGFFLKPPWDKYYLVGGDFSKVSFQKGFKVLVGLKATNEGVR